YRRGRPVRANPPRPRRAVRGTVRSLLLGAVRADPSRAGRPHGDRGRPPGGVPQAVAGPAPARPARGRGRRLVAARRAEPGIQPAAQPAPRPGASGTPRTLAGQRERPVRGAAARGGPSRGPPRARRAPRAPARLPALAP